MIPADSHEIFDRSGCIHFQQKKKKSLKMPPADIHERCQWCLHANSLSLSASGDFYRLLINFSNRLDPDQARQNVGPDLYPN